MFLGIGLPYNSYFMNREELKEIGEKIASMNDEVQVCLFRLLPTFRRWDMSRPTFEEMMKTRNILLESGLKTVIAQTEIGLGP